MEESIESLRNLSLTERDFDLLVAGLEHLPNKDTAGDLMGEMLIMGLARDEEDKERMKNDLEKKRVARDREKRLLVEDSKILQGKLLMLKRFLIENNLMKDVDTFSNPDVGMPWAEAWCAAGEWGGVPDPNEPEPETDPWINCEKYKDNGKSDTDTRQDIRPNS